MARKKRITKRRLEKDLHTAREVEKHNILDEDKAIALYKEGLTFSQKLKKLLRPAWFVRDSAHHRRKK